MASSASPYSARAMPYASAASALSGERSRARFRSRRPSSMRSHARCSFPDSMSASMALPPPTPREGPAEPRLPFLSFFLFFFLWLPWGGIAGPRERREREREVVWRRARGGGGEEKSTAAGVFLQISTCPPSLADARSHSRGARRDDDASA